MPTTAQRGATSAADIIPAMGYVRVSSKLQTDGYTQEVQRRAIREYAAREGYYLVGIAEDVQRGRIVTRAGYQGVLESVRRGESHAVIVYMFDRWGRDGAEWAARARELERLRVPFVSVQEGREEGGVMRYVRAGMAEEYSRQLAKRVRPAREEAARAGTHLGPTPWGYARFYAPHVGARRAQAGTLVPVEGLRAWVVALFERAALGQDSLRRLAVWLNTAEGHPTAPAGGTWHQNVVGTILRNPVYCGDVRYNQEPTGYYDRAEAGSAFTVPGTHEAIIGRDLWARVQDAIGQRRGPQRRGSERREPLMAEGFLRCAGCGARIQVSCAHTHNQRHPQYRCAGQDAGASACREQGYSAPLAHAAIIDQLCRLHAAPWDDGRMARMAEADDRAAEREVLAAAIERKDRALRRHMRYWEGCEVEPNADELRMHREVTAEYVSELRALNARMDVLRQEPTSVSELRALHEQLAGMLQAWSLRAWFDAGDDAGLRRFMARWVESAVIDRKVVIGARRWAHARITWSEQVRRMLDAGLLTLSADVEAPDWAPVSSPARIAYMREYRARKRHADKALGAASAGTVR